MDGPQREVLTSKSSCGTSASSKQHQNSPALPDFLKRTVGSTESPASVRRVSSPRPAIHDYNNVGISDTITVPESVTIDFVKVGLDISHTYPRGLSASLTTPWGVVVELLPRGAGGRTQEVKITYDEAKLPALSTLRGRNSQGAWKLTVQELGPADKGTLNSWVLDIGSAATTTGPVELKESPGTQIQDYPAAGIARSLANGKAFGIGSVEVFVDISHTFIGDLQVSLVSPQGTAIVLHEGAGGSTRGRKDLHRGRHLATAHRGSGGARPGQAEQLAAADQAIAPVAG